LKWKKIVGAIFYLCAVPMMAYAIWSYMKSAEIIAEAIEFGQITVAANRYEIVSFYMANSGDHFVYALLLAGIGLLLHTGFSGKSVAGGAMLDQEKSQNDAELDEWFGDSDEDDLEEENNVSNN
jgi:hypothetical protein